MKRMHSRQKLIASHPVSEDVGERVRRTPVKLLGRHIREGTEHGSVGSDSGGGSLGDQGDAKVHDLDAAVAKQHDVRGFHVAVNDAVHMGMMQAGRALRDNVDFFEQRKGAPAGDDSFEIVAFHQLHH